MEKLKVNQNSQSEGAPLSDKRKKLAPVRVQANSNPEEDDSL